jgi:surfeit locus 1 family protein
VKSKIILGLLAIAIEICLLRLGFWQLARGDEKERALQAVQTVLTEKRALAFESALTAQAGYTWVSGALRFGIEPLALLDNQRRGTQVGVRVFQLAQSRTGEVLWVELGWLPVNGQRQLPKPAALRGEIQVSGLLMPAPSSGFAIGRALVTQADGTLLLTRFDVSALAAAIKRPVSARILRLDPALAIGFTRDLNVQANTLPPEKHRGYALQWFGLALAFALLCFGLCFRKNNNG